MGWGNVPIRPNPLRSAMPSASDLHRAPNFNPVFHKPLNDKRRFIIPATEAVEHKHQKNIKFPFDCVCLDFLNGVPIFCGNLEAGNAFFVEFLRDDPVLLPRRKFVAALSLHRNIVLFYLSDGRHSIKAIYTLIVIHNIHL